MVARGEFACAGYYIGAPAHPGVAGKALVQYFGCKYRQFHGGIGPWNCRTQCQPNLKGRCMPKLTVADVGEFEVPVGKRLVLALEQDAGIDQLHACGGHARCTTCKVEFVHGEPARMTVAERDVLAARGLRGVRLSCQILCDHDMEVRAISRFEGSGRKDSGSPPSPDIEPVPVWTD
jgi:ferredoxin